MSQRREIWLFGCLIWLVLMAAVAALIVTNFKHHVLPLAAFFLLLTLTIIKARIVILDFMDLRHEGRAAARLLTSWIGLLLVLALTRGLLQLVLV